MTIVKWKSLAVATALAALMVAGCGGSGSSKSDPAAPLRTGFLCCNLHYEAGGDWISDTNHQDQPFFPVGSTAAVTSPPGRNRANISVDGRAMRLGLDYGRAFLTMSQYIDRTIVTDDPKIKIATFSPDVQAAIKKGLVMKGMTKEELLMAIGYPAAHENPNLNARLWRYWSNWNDEFQVIWDAEDTVKEVTGGSGTLARVLYTPK